VFASQEAELRSARRLKPAPTERIRLTTMQIPYGLGHESGAKDPHLPSNLPLELIVQT